jgi:hypothetical protein
VKRFGKMARAALRSAARQARSKSGGAHVIHRAAQRCSRTAERDTPIADCARASSFAAPSTV